LTLLLYFQKVRFLQFAAHLEKDRSGGRMEFMKHQDPGSDRNCQAPACEITIFYVD
jgi:hypothetical protein